MTLINVQFLISVTQMLMPNPQHMVQMQLWWKCSNKVQQTTRKFA